ncbi:MAG: TerB family tellurite resistance protein [Labilithrix sp.]|nr:TerB family tellurite resistance protein [Labilithrix sp.]MCW5817827.1 TerB family tellurite resistance protein [Labilithrix sp.]
MSILGFFRSSEDKRGLVLLRTVREHMPDAADEDVKIVASIVGLLGQVAVVDRPYLPVEEARIRAVLEDVRGVGRAGVDAIVATLRASIVNIAELEAREYARFLRELADRDLRLHVLDLLLDVAAADERVSVAEVNHLRRLTDVLGLTQDDYVASQARHRDKLVGLS